jgi:hypothetical protein
MTDIIARSRIGFWTAFVSEGRPVLNTRHPDTLEAVTVALRDDEAETLAGSYGAAHALARSLTADTGRHAAEAIATPGIQAIEPVTHEWEAEAVVETIRRIAA